MGKKLLTFVLGATLTCVAYAAETPKKSPVSDNQIKVEPLVVEVGQTMKIDVTYKLEEGWRPAAWRLMGYEFLLPKGVQNNAKFKCNVNKNKVWSSYSLTELKWLSKEQSLASLSGMQHDINTTDWPVGDYKAKIHIEFRKGDEKVFHTVHWECVFAVAPVKTDKE